MTGGDLLWKLWRDERVRRELAERRNVVIESPEYVFLVHPITEIAMQRGEDPEMKWNQSAYRSEWRGIWIIVHPGLPDGQVRLVRTAQVRTVREVGPRPGATP